MSPHRLTKFRIAVYGVLIEDGRVLELGEAPLKALVREFREVTALKVTALKVRLGQLIFCSQLFQRNNVGMSGRASASVDCRCYPRVSRASASRSRAQTRTTLISPSFFYSLVG